MNFAVFINLRMLGQAPGGGGSSGQNARQQDDKAHQHRVQDQQDILDIVYAISRYIDGVDL